MDLYREIPIRVVIEDKVGIPQSKLYSYLKPAYKIMNTLTGKCIRGNLDQLSRTTMIRDNVSVKCDYKHGKRLMIIVVGAISKETEEEEKCWCCGPCIVAGKIIDIVNINTKESIKEETFVFDEDDDYYATVRVCQKYDKVGTSVTKRYIVLESGNISNARTIEMSPHGFVAQTLQGVPFSCYNEHKVGDSVLVLVMPLFDFSTYPANFSPCINKRKVASTIVEFSPLSITNSYLNSTGYSCQMTRDYEIWDGEYGGDSKYNPFRILPIKIESCLS